MVSRLTQLALIAAFAFLAGCMGTTTIEQPDAQSDFTSEVYTIGVGDELSVSVWKHPDLSVQLPVRPDGKISVPLIGDIMAAGVTPEALSDSITKALTTYIRSPAVTVLITTPSSTDFLQRVRITGAVENPTSIPYRKGMTVLDLVLIAGGTNDFASPSKAKLYRRVDGVTKVYPIDLDDILDGGKLETNYNLFPSDVVTVPERLF